MRVLSAALAFLVCACTTQRIMPEQAQQTSIVTVDNTVFPDVNVYVVAEGSGPRRLGTVTGHTTAQFGLKAHEVAFGHQLFFIGRPIGGGENYVAPPIESHPGVEYLLTIGPLPGNTSAWYRQAMWQSGSRLPGNSQEVAGITVTVRDSGAFRDSVYWMYNDSLCRAPSCRSASVARAFDKATGHVGGWPGHVRDHMVPLECGGPDTIENLQWQTVEEAKAKDRIENQCWRWIPHARSDGRAVPNPSTT